MYMRATLKAAVRSRKAACAGELRPRRCSSTGGSLSADLLGLRQKTAFPEAQRRQISCVLRSSMTGVSGIFFPNFSRMGAWDLKCHRVRFSL